MYCFSGHSRGFMPLADLGLVQFCTEKYQRELFNGPNVCTPFTLWLKVYIIYRAQHKKHYTNYLMK